MKFKFALLVWCCLLFPANHVWAGVDTVDAGVNLTDFTRHRNGRSLIFQGGGTLKLSLGPSMPVNLADPVIWRSLVCSYNLQGGHYSIPTEPLYPWDKWEDTFARSMQRVKKNLGNVHHNYQPDDSRLFVYTVLETILSRQNDGRGRACLLRSICENAQVDHHVGMLSEILNLILTPGKEHLDAIYTAAQMAGASGADCLKLYADCPAGANLLDWYLDYV